MQFLAIYYDVLLCTFHIQGVAEQYDDIVFATGSGGTASGLSIANYLTGSKLKYVIVCDCIVSETSHSITFGLF